MDDCNLALRDLTQTILIPSEVRGILVQVVPPSKVCVGGGGGGEGVYTPSSPPLGFSPCHQQNYKMATCDMMQGLFQNLLTFK